MPAPPKDNNPQARTPCATHNKIKGKLCHPNQRQNRADDSLSGELGLARTNFRAFLDQLIDRPQQDFWFF